MKKHSPRLMINSKIDLRRKQRSFVLVVGSFLLVIALITTGRLAYDWYFGNNSKETFGQINQKVKVRERVKKGVRFVTYKVNYMYTVDGTQYYGYDELKSAPGSSSIKVYYLENYPQTSRLVSGDISTLGVALAAVAWLLSLASFRTAVTFQNDIKRELAALAEESADTPLVQSDSLQKGIGKIGDSGQKTLKRQAQALVRKQSGNAPVNPACESDPDVIVEFTKRRNRQFIALLVVMLCLAPLVLLGGAGPDTLGGIPFLIVAPLTSLVMICVAIYSFFNWRCPACNGTIGRRFNPRKCEKCGAKLQV